MPVLRAELFASGKNTTGFVVPDDFVERLGGGRHPKVRVRLNDTEFATSIAAMSGRFLLGVSAERRQAAGVAAGAVNDLGGALALADRLGLSPTTSVGAGHPDQVRHPITWSRSPLRTPTPPPALGEHSTVLRTRLEDTP